MDYTPQYPVPKDLIFDSGHLERILIALLRADIAVAIEVSLHQKIFWIHLGYGYGDGKDLLSALDKAVSNLPDNLRWKFFEEYDKAR